ncbi:putative nucleotidyltransferase substrate binding domain-containing protein [Neobacillus niacini]|uniref:putative nucleotidyltransferase substrate binding domain-containing protein n=1 Tax=Neobacillus niacini TaxID=86668 RepID=UPI003B587DD4
MGVLGQPLVESHGSHTGSLDLKEKAQFPYVNAICQFAIKARILETFTLSRLEKLPESGLPSIKKEVYKNQFLKLLVFRLSYSKPDNYGDGHYLPINSLSKKTKGRSERYCRKLIVFSFVLILQ